jgi:hypothetical protein
VTVITGTFTLITVSRNRYFSRLLTNERTWKPRDGVIEPVELHEAGCLEKLAVTRPNKKWPAFNVSLTLWRRSLSKCYLRIQSVPQREHHTSPLQSSTG